MARYVKDIVLNKPEDFVNFIMQDYLRKNQFVMSEWKGEIILPSLIQRTGIIKKCAFAV